MNFTTAFFGLITWFPLCVWVLCLVQWAIGGDIDIISAIVGVSFALVLGVVAMRPPVDIISPIACFTAFAGIVTYPIVNSASNRYGLKQLDIQEVENAYRIIGQTPSNPLAKFKLAKAIYKLGFIGHAVALGDVSMAGTPRQVAEEEYRTLQRWKRIGVPPQTLKPLSCVECHTPCLPGWTHCRTCGSQFLLQRAKGQLLPGGFAQKVIAVWGGAVILLIGIPIALTFDLGPALAMCAVLIASVAVGLFFTLRKGREA